MMGIIEAAGIIFYIFFGVISCRECPHLYHPNNGQVVVEDYHPGGLAVYKCHRGFILHGTNWRKCLDDFTWTWQEPVCYDVKSLPTPPKERISTPAPISPGTATLKPTTPYAEGLHHVTVCEKNSKILTCPENLFINVQSAIYGRMDEITCTKKFIKTTFCRSETSDKIVKEDCNGERKCKVAANSLLYGDPCRGINKYLAVWFTCGKKNKMAVIAK